MSSSYNFKDNLTIDNNKYLKWLDSTGTSRANIIALNEKNDLVVNSDVTNNSNTFFNKDISSGNVFIGTKLGIGFNSTSNMSCNLTMNNNSFIGVNTTIGTSDGFLGFSGSFGNDGNGSKVILYGNDNVVNKGNLHLYAGNVSNGNINMYVGDNSLTMQILQDGTLNYIPNGITPRLTIDDSKATFTSDVIITSTSQSLNASSGALQIRGGIGITGNLYVDGTISLNEPSGNINFDSTQTSSSYTTGAIFITGGLGISTTVNSSSITAGGALSIAGGGAFAKDVYIGGQTFIVNTSPTTSSQIASLVIYGGMGINDKILSRSDSSQIQIAPKTNGLSTEIVFYSLNNFQSNTNSGTSWKIGQNIDAIGSGNFGISNSNIGMIFSISYNGNSNFKQPLNISDSTNASGVNNGGSFTISGGASIKKDVYIGGMCEINNLSIVSTRDSVNTTTGAIISSGGITINNTRESLSSTEGGSILTAGGVSIGKSLFVGGPIMKIPDGNISQRPNPAKLGYIRYNTETQQFEGYGPGSAWGSLGGVIDIAQTTKVLASETPNVTDGNLYFYTVGSERMRINSSGNIGIGTSAPNYKLDVKGTIAVSDDMYITGNSQLQGSVTIGELLISSGITSNIITGNLSTIGSIFVTGESILNTLNVTGSSLFHNTVTIGSLRVINQSILENVSCGSINVSETSSFTHNSNTFGNIFTTGGNIGINTTDPNYNLDVNGSIRVNTNLYVNGNILGNNLSTFSNLTLTSTNPSINSSNGSLLAYGGITIISTVNANSVTNGGSLLTNGGAAVGKMLFVGDSVNVTNNIQTNTLTISSTENGLGIGTGGSLTVLGGGSISKDLYVGGTVTSSSDIRLKTNITNFKNANDSILNKIDNLRTIKYTYKDDESHTPYVGFVAQDFVSDFPEFTRCPEGGFYSLDYQKISVILLECVKELKIQVRLLEQEIESNKKPVKRILKGKRIYTENTNEDSSKNINEN